MRGLSVLFVLVTVAGGLACEPEVGGLCDPDPKKVADHIEVKKGTNNLVQDVELDNCSEGFCLSTDGSRPYCTKQCEADIECAEAGEGFTCQAVINFGPLACQDYEQFKDNKTSGDCQADGTCTNTDETCQVDVTDGQQKCGVPGKDCLTGDNGAFSALPLKYCAASPDVIAARDKQYGR